MPRGPRASARARGRAGGRRGRPPRRCRRVLAHADVQVGETGDLREVGHDEHLPARRRASRAAGRRRAPPVRRCRRPPRRTRASGTSSRSARMLRHASITRDSSPPLAVFASGSHGCAGPPRSGARRGRRPDGPGGSSGSTATWIAAPSIPSSSSSPRSARRRAPARPRLCPPTDPRPERRRAPPARRAPARSASRRSSAPTTRATSRSEASRRNASTSASVSPYLRCRAFRAAILALTSSSRSGSTTSDSR